MLRIGGFAAFHQDLEIEVNPRWMLEGCEDKEKCKLLQLDQRRSRRLTVQTATDLVRCKARGMELQCDQMAAGCSTKMALRKSRWMALPAKVTLEAHLEGEQLGTTPPAQHGARPTVPSHALALQREKQTARMALRTTPDERYSPLL